MIECDYCAAARVRSCGMYRIGCHGCIARSIARSLAAFNSLDPKGTGDKEALRAAVARMLPSVPVKDARQMVMVWWREDHEGVLA